MLVMGGKAANPIKILSVNYDCMKWSELGRRGRSTEFIRLSEYNRSSTADSENIDLG
jgi:hypothetical protein